MQTPYTTKDMEWRELFRKGKLNPDTLAGWGLKIKTNASVERTEAFLYF